MNTKQLVILYIAALSVTWCLGHMLGLYASINPMIFLLMVSLLLALGWLVTQLITEKGPAAQKVSARPGTGRQHRNASRASSYASRSYASQSGSSSNSSGADLTTLATLAILSNTDTGPTCTGGVSDSGSSRGDGGGGD
ncbi:hypothetical protein [Pseudomonas sp. JZ134]|uniref:hypothetical protein n=1 Tax=Pseudomonas sp. JZ134 TaxID=2806615 RepID=UPI003DA04E4F